MGTQKGNFYEFDQTDPNDGRDKRSYGDNLRIMMKQKNSEEGITAIYFPPGV
jgi:hypothetical protein